jgi:hypothetical protein
VNDDEPEPSIRGLAMALERTEDSAYLLSSDLRLLHTSKGWTTFAENNGGLGTLARWVTGSPIDDAWPSALSDFYRAAYASALATGERWEHEYDCSSPLRYRRFRMFVYPIDRRQILVVNSLVVEMPHGQSDRLPGDLYVFDGFLTMCANCRRTLNPQTHRWDWVPAYVERMPEQTSHGLCPACVEVYYPPEP